MKAAAPALALALVTCLSACVASPAQPGLKDAVALDYRLVPLSSNGGDENQVGRLIYRGGLEITSPDPRFGGWSGLVVSADGGRMLSQSDEAHWLRADLVYNAQGDLVGIRHGELADMLDMHGHTMNKYHGDAEGLVALSPRGPDGAVLVSFEEDVRVWHYDLSHGLEALPTDVPLPKSVHVLDGSNWGLEGLTMIRPGTALAVAETPHEDNADHDAWAVPYPSPVAGGRYGMLHVAYHSPYAISDAAMGPDGKYLYLLERHYYGFLRGIAIALRRVSASSVQPGARVGGEEIAEFGMTETIDNMEGLSLRRGADGKTYVYMISDDNYSLRQRTLLMMFELAKE